MILVQEELEPIELRMILAWRQSNMPLGALLMRATNEYHVAPTCDVIDAAMVEMIERYVEEHCQ